MYYALLFLSFVFCATDEVMARFKSWKEEHGKSYHSQEEENLRLRNFQATLEEIEIQNKQDGAVFVTNQFADMTHEEFYATVGSFSLDAHAKNYRRSEFEEDNKFEDIEVHAPNKMDWRKQNIITAIKNQGQCASCWAVATAEIVETANLMKNKQTPLLSAQQILDCTAKVFDCTMGGAPAWGLDVIKKIGVTTEQAYPYRATKGNCKYKNNSSPWKISSYLESYPPNQGKYRPSGPYTESWLRDKITASGPSMSSVEVGPWKNYGSGVMKASQCPQNLQGHYVQIIGWDMDAKPAYWIARNSWGSRWGESGYIRLEMGTDVCKMFTRGHCFTDITP